MSIQLSTRVMHVKDEATGSYDTIDVIKGRDGQIPEIDSALSSISENPVQNKVVHAAITSLNEDIIQFPPVKDSDATGVDLDVSDEDGNVLVRFEDGEIQMKEFDSRNATSSDGQLTDPNTDLYLADASGNALARFANGHFGTSRFSSGDINHSKTFTVTSASGSQTMDYFFPEGTQLALHMCQSDIKGWYAIKGYKLTYKYTDKNNVEHTIGQDYGFNFFRYTLTEDAIAINVSYPNDLTPGTYAFTAYTEASFNKKPKIITVAADGSREYTSLRSAIDSIPVDVCEINPYEIHIYPGTYNILDDYSAVEIAETGFKGLWLVNGMSLIGIGRRDEIVIRGELDTTAYDQTKRNDVSTINVLGNIHVENVTIEAYHIRYAVHDEEMTYRHHLSKHYWKNVKFYGSGLTSGGGGNTSYGSGIRSYVEHEYIDCDFSDSYVLHTDSNIVHPVYARYENCNARKFRFGDYDTGGTVCHAYFYNCKAAFICIEAGTVHDQYFYIHGEGISDVMVKCPSGYVYETGDTLRFYDDNISAGKAVKIVNLYDSRQNNLVVTSSLVDIYGVSIGTIGDDTVIQTRGYINSNTLGLTGLSVGDYLTVDTSGTVVSGGTAANAIAVVKMVDNDGVAYAKLMI